jgi:hypothetical protein
MNRRVMHRPMFRKGGSASEGITSGLRQHPVNKKNFRGILQFEYDAKGKATPNYSSYIVGQVFYNPEDGLFYEKIADEGAITDFKALDPFTYD